MEKIPITIQVQRFKPNVIDPPIMQSFHIRVSPDITILDCLEIIRHSNDSSLMYRHSCHHSSCGTCALTINGKERLACITRVSELQTNIIILKPLQGFNCVADLVVEISPFINKLKPDWSYRKKVPCNSSERTPDGVDHLFQLESCIECGCCQAACPVTDDDKPFLGPAVLAAINNEIKKSPQKLISLLKLANGEDGQERCDRALLCSRVCPTNVSPARHIADIRRKVDLKHS